MNKYTALVTQLDIIDWMLDTDINSCDKDGNTLLMYACKANNVKIVSLLLNHDADVNAFSNNKTPLMYASENNNIELINLLIESDADPNLYLDHENTIQSEGATALSLGRTEGSPEASLRGPSDRTEVQPHVPALVSICSHNNISLVRLLIKSGADVNIHDSENKTPLIVACLNDNIDIVKLLLDNGANVNITYKNEFTPLIIACQNNNILLVKLLLDYEADINMPNKNKLTPLMKVYEKNITLIKMLLEQGAVIN